MSKHTPGLWQVVADPRKGSKRLLVATCHEIPYVIASVCGSPREAHANVLAAAPELLAALEQARAVIDELGSMTIITDYLAAKWPKTLLRMGLSEIASGAAVQKATGGA